MHSFICDCIRCSNKEWIKTQRHNLSIFYDHYRIHFNGAAEYFCMSECQQMQYIVWVNGNITHHLNQIAYTLLSNIKIVDKFSLEIMWMNGCFRCSPMLFHHKSRPVKMMCIYGAFSAKDIERLCALFSRAV